MKKVAIISGVNGQDGSYLAEFILDNNEYDVLGVTRRSSTDKNTNIQHLICNPRFRIFEADLCDFSSVLSLFGQLTDGKYDRIEIYNLAAQSHVHTSFDQPEYTANVNGLGPLRILEAIRSLGLHKITRMYQASTSEMYGKVQEVPQSETTQFYPRSPYGVSKLYGFWIVKNYRESYGMFACNGILFNHESERRGLDFVTRKITSGIPKVYGKEKNIIRLGNLDSKRDWGHAEDYVRAMWLMLQADNPEDYVIATGEMRTVRDFVETAFKVVGHTITWSGEGVNEIGTDETGETVVSVDPAYYRPCEVDVLLGNPTKAETCLGWKRIVSFKNLVSRMVQNDMAIYTKNTLSRI